MYLSQRLQPNPTIGLTPTRLSSTRDLSSCWAELGTLRPESAVHPREQMRRSADRAASDRNRVACWDERRAFGWPQLVAPGSRCDGLPGSDALSQGSARQPAELDSTYDQSGRTLFSSPRSPCCQPLSIVTLTRRNSSPRCRRRRVPHRLYRIQWLLPCRCRTQRQGIRFGRRIHRQSSDRAAMVDGGIPSARGGNPNENGGANLHTFATIIPLMRSERQWTGKSMTCGRVCCWPVNGPVVEIPPRFLPGPGPWFSGTPAGACSVTS